jgi:hypothetical protein
LAWLECRRKDDREKETVASAGAVYAGNYWEQITQEAVEVAADYLHALQSNAAQAMVGVLALGMATTGKSPAAP